VSNAFVADASVAIGWVHPAQATSETDAMLTAIAHGATLEVPASPSGNDDDASH
jgi:hypothetical protein